MHVMVDWLNAGAKAVLSHTLTEPPDGTGTFVVTWNSQEVFLAFTI